jgi:3-hydroxybutyryl-CoA dehydrogenase
MEKLVSKGVLSQTDVDQARGRLELSTDVGLAAEGADIVIESVVEILEVKQATLLKASASAHRNAILGTNTSQLSITAIGSALGDGSSRVVGIHFFNPPVLMRLIELIRGLETSDKTLERARIFSESLGKETVVCLKDSPGFLTSRVSAIVRLECFRMLEEGVGSAEDIDKALRLGLNFPMGPLALGDFNGLDTYLHILENLSDTLGERFRPPVTLRNLVSAGRLGRKSGRGVYTYNEDGALVSDEARTQT